MILYRIAKCNYAADLSGAGARLYGGRWNSIGQPMVYMAASPSLAVLEVLVHLPPSIFPANFCLAEFDISDNSILTADNASLPDDWQDVSPPIALKRLGDAFLKQNKYLLMKVPSVIVPQEFNYLLNPLHTDAAKIKLVEKKAFSFDARLVSTLTSRK
ncbi:MAG: RES family NAD+ phosphorylase [Mucilaginibacter sp.]